VCPAHLHSASCAVENRTSMEVRRASCVVEGTTAKTVVATCCTNVHRRREWRWRRRPWKVAHREVMRMYIVIDTPVLAAGRCRVRKESTCQVQSSVSVFGAAARAAWEVLRANPRTRQKSNIAKRMRTRLVLSVILRAVDRGFQSWLLKCSSVHQTRTKNVWIIW
jgi:hypothetical protein